MSNIREHAEHHEPDPPPGEKNNTSNQNKLKNKNVCMFTFEFLPHYGGTETLVDTASRELLKNNLNVHILTRSHPGCKKESIEGGVHITRTDLLSHNRDEINDKEFYDYLVNYLEENKIDIIHTHSIHRCGVSPTGLAVTNILHSASMRMKIPTILHVHLPVDKPDDGFALNTFNWNYIIPISRWAAKQVYNAGICPSKMKVINNFVDVNKFKPGIHNGNQREQLIKKLNLDEGKKIILTPSRLLIRNKIDERKHLDIVLHGLSHLSNEKDFIAILTALEDEYYPKESKEAKNKLQEMAEVLEVDDKIRIPRKNLPQDMIPALYSLSDIVALPSSDEPFGLVYIEGMASGKPVIGAISGAVTEIIIHNKTGLLVEPKSPFALFQALKKLFDKPKIAEQCGKNGRRLVLRKYSVSKRINDFLFLYRMLLR